MIEQSQSDDEQDVPAQSLAGWAFKPVNFTFGGTLSEKTLAGNQEIKREITKERITKKRDGRIMVDGSGVLARRELPEDLTQPSAPNESEASNERATEDTAEQFYRQTIGAARQVQPPDDTKHCPICDEYVIKASWKQHLRGISHLHAMHNGPSQPAESPKDSATQTYRNKPGFHLLRTMGWVEGTGLGANQQGATEPIQVVMKHDRRGLGQSIGPNRVVGQSHTTRKAAQPIMTESGRKQREKQQRDERHRARLLSYLKD